MTSKNPKTSRTLLSVNECAARLSVSVGSIRKWIANGTLAYQKIGPRGQTDICGRDRRMTRVLASELEQVQENFRAKPL